MICLSISRWLLSTCGLKRSYHSCHSSVCMLLVRESSFKELTGLTPHKSKYITGITLHRYKELTCLTPHRSKYFTGLILHRSKHLTGLLFFPTPPVFYTPAAHTSTRNLQMVQLEKFQPGAFYHIYNEGNNKEPLFIEDRNFPYFLRLWHKYLSPLSEAYAYCLLRNQFHFLIHIRETSDLVRASGIRKQTRLVPKLSNFISLQFAHLFNAYSKSFNKAYDRTGSLFRERFRRRSISMMRKSHH